MISPGIISSVLNNNETGETTEQAKATRPKHHVGTTMITQDSQAIEANAEGNQAKRQQPTEGYSPRSGYDETSQAPEKTKHANSKSSSGPFMIMQVDTKIEADA